MTVKTVSVSAGVVESLQRVVDTACNGQKLKNLQTSVNNETVLGIEHIPVQNQGVGLVVDGPIETTLDHRSDIDLDHL